VTEPDLDALLAHFIRHELPALYFLIDADDVIVETNRQTRELFAQEVVGTRLAELLTTFDREATAPGLDRASDTARRLNFLTFTGLPQTFVCWCSRVGDRVAVLGGLEGKALQTLQHDLVRTNQALHVKARELARANAELARLATLRDTFFGMAVHDLRSPLSAILQNVELLAEEGAEPGLVADLQTAAELMQGVVDGFLRMAIISSGHLRLVRTPTVFAEAVERGLSVVRPIAARKGVPLRFSPGPPVEVSVDRGKIEQVVVNLVKNAVEHSQPGAEVEVTVAPTPDSVSLAVRDHGTGIAPAVLANLFEAYAGSDNKTAGERSVGLGLSITKLIVEAHGGRVTVDTEVGVGTAWTVLLPR